MPEKSDIFFRYLEEEQGKHKERALTSVSCKNKDHNLDDRNTNRELATYGDALLKFVLSEMLLDQVDNITEEKKKYESDEVLVKVIARHYDLCRYIRLDDSNADIPRNYEYKKNANHESPHKYIATAVEALLAAYYLDHGKELGLICKIVEKWKDVIDKTV